MKMATLPLSSSSLNFLSPLLNSFTSSPPLPSSNLTFSLSSPRRFSKLSVSSSEVCDAPQQSLIIDQSALLVEEAVSEDALWAAACLRIRTFNEYKEDSFGLEDHKRYLAEREFEALKERVAGKREGFRKVSCINATLPLSHLSALSGDLCTSCKFSDDGGSRIVVGTLDLNQCLRLPDEMTGMKPQGIGADFLRAYLSNVCVAKELHRNGLGYVLVSKAKCVAEEWGTVSVTDGLSF
uniref:N-acetyltransferase domain-containing protein n=1 Tax=Chenopodium quinoa TaxID=63459 RepID=A0A803MFJ3_CHEQI